MQATTATDNNDRPWNLRVWNPFHEYWQFDRLAKSTFGSQEAAAKKAASLLGAETSSDLAVRNDAGGFDFLPFPVTAVLVYTDAYENGTVVA